MNLSKAQLKHQFHEDILFSASAFDELQPLHEPGYQTRDGYLYYFDLQNRLVYSFNTWYLRWTLETNPFKKERLFTLFEHQHPI